MKGVSKITIAGLAIFVLILLVIQAGCGAAPTTTPTTTTSPTSTPTSTVTTKPTTTPTPTPTPTTKATPTPTPTTTAAAKPLTLVYSSFLGYDPLGRAGSIEWWAKEIEKRTAGRVKFNIHWAQTLVKATEMPEALAKGIVDAGDMVPSYMPGKLPLTQVAELPAGSSSQLAMALAWNELYATTPSVQQEWTRYDVRVMVSHANQTFDLVFKKPVSTLADVKGLKVRTHAESFSRQVAGVGMVPVSMTSVEVYEALARGVVDAIVQALEALNTYKWYEVAPYYMRADLGGQAGANIVIANKAWDKISPDDQKAIDDIGKEWPAYLAKFYIDGDAIRVKSLQAAKKEFSIGEFSAADKAQIKASGLAYWDVWIKSMEDKGLPGKDVAAKWKSLLEKYEKQLGVK